jgi:hypothetical protein
MKASVVTAHGGPQVMKNQDMPDSWAPSADKGSNDHKKNSMKSGSCDGSSRRGTDSTS